MDNKKAIIAICAGVVLLVLAMIFLRPSDGQPGMNGQDGRDGVNVGALASPDIPSPYLQWGGVVQFSQGAPLLATSSVICYWQAPATSTVDMLGLVVTANSPAAAQQIDISTSSSMFGSSSPAFIRAAAIGTAPTAAAPNTIAWTAGLPTSTPMTGILALGYGSTTGASPYIINTGEFVTWRIATAAPSGVASAGLSGKCTLKATAL